MKGIFVKENNKTFSLYFGLCQRANFNSNISGKSLGHNIERIGENSHFCPLIFLKYSEFILK